MSFRNYDQCGGKNCYSKNAAEKVKESSMKQRSKKIRMYLCPECHYYHLSSLINSLPPIQKKQL